MEGMASRWITGMGDSPQPERVTLDLTKLGIEPEPWREQWGALVSTMAARVADRRESQLVWAIVAYLLDESMDHCETTLVIPREKLEEILSRPGVPEVIDFSGQSNPDGCVGIRIHRRPPSEDA